MKRVNLKLPDDKHMKLRIMALTEKTTLQKLIEQAIDDITLKRKPKPK